VPIEEYIDLDSELETENPIDLWQLMIRARSRQGGAEIVLGYRLQRDVNKAGNPVLINPQGKTEPIKWSKGDLLVVLHDNSVSEARTPRSNPKPRMDSSPMARGLRASASPSATKSIDCYSPAQSVSPMSTPVAAELTTKEKREEASQRQEKRRVEKALEVRIEARGSPYLV